MNRFVTNKKTAVLFLVICNLLQP